MTTGITYCTSFNYVRYVSNVGYVVYYIPVELISEFKHVTISYN